MVTYYPNQGTVGVGGLQIAASRLVHAIAARGVQVTVVVPTVGQRREMHVADDDGIAVIRVPTDEDGR